MYSLANETRKEDHEISVTSENAPTQGASINETEVTEDAFLNSVETRGLRTPNGAEAQSKVTSPANTTGNTSAGDDSNLDDETLEAVQAIHRSYYKKGVNRRNLGILGCLFLITAVLFGVLVPTVFLKDKESESAVSSANQDNDRDIGNVPETPQPETPQQPESPENEDTADEIDTEEDENGISNETEVADATSQPESPAEPGVPAEPEVAPITIAPTISPTVSPTQSPTVAPTLAPTDVPTKSPITVASPEEVAVWTVLKDGLLDSTNLQISSSVEHKVFEWLVGSDPTFEQQPIVQNLLADGEVSGAASVRILQRYTLALMDVKLHSDDDSIPQVRRRLQTIQTVFADPATEECNWEGVSCQNKTLDGETIFVVDKIVWAQKGLTGIIPKEIINLQDIAYLDLAENSISGGIPNELYELTSLQHLYLHSNQLTGELSSRIGQLGALKRLYLGNNKLSGPLPQELGSPSTGAANVRPLQYLILYNNSFSGTIPLNWNLRELFYLDLGYNELEGPIPADWSEGQNTLRRLRQLYLSNNKLSGSLSGEFPNLGAGRMQQIVLNDNQLTGAFDFDEKFEIRNKLNNLEIHNNEFKSISKDICEMIVFIGGELTNIRADCGACSCSYFCDRDFCA